jgi:hypothetical protein
MRMSYIHRALFAPAGALTPAAGKGATPNVGWACSAVALDAFPCIRQAVPMPLAARAIDKAAVLCSTRLWLKINSLRIRERENFRLG